MVKCYTKKGVAQGKNNKICFDDNGKILNSSNKNNSKSIMPSKKAPPPAEKRGVGRPITTGKQREDRKDGFMPTATLREMEKNKTKINFKKQNPKKEGTKAHEKYEKYKSATTIGKALELGATMRDLQNDFEKGFVAKMKVAVAKIDRRPDKAQFTPPPSLIASDMKEAFRKGKFTVSKTGGRATARDKLKKEGGAVPMAGGKSKRSLLKKGEAI